MTNCMHGMCSICVLVGSYKCSHLNESMIKLFILDREQVFAGHVVDKAKVSMRPSTLLLVNKLCSILNHLNAVKVLLYLRVEKADFTLFELKFTIHINLTSPNLSFEVAEHFLACHFQEVGDLNDT